MRAIKAGIFTAATKSELEKLEAERTRWTQLLQDRSAKVDKVAAMLPRAADRYVEPVSELASLSDKNRTKAREQIRTLVGESGSARRGGGQCSSRTRSPLRKPRLSPSEPIIRM